MGNGALTVFSLSCKPVYKPDYVPERTRVTIIHLGRCSRNASSHLPATRSGRSIGRLFDVAPRRDCPFHPTRSRLVSVALIRASRRTGVTCYGALQSPDFPLVTGATSDRPTDFHDKMATLQDFTRIGGEICNFFSSLLRCVSFRCGKMTGFEFPSYAFGDSLPCKMPLCVPHSPLSAVP